MESDIKNETTTKSKSGKENLIEEEMIEEDREIDLVENASNMESDITNETTTKNKSSKGGKK